MQHMGIACQGLFRLIFPKSFLKKLASSVPGVANKPLETSPTRPRPPTDRRRSSIRQRRGAEQSPYSDQPEPGNRPGAPPRASGRRPPAPRWRRRHRPAGTPLPALIRRSRSRRQLRAGANPAPPPSISECLRPSRGGAWTPTRPPASRRWMGVEADASVPQPWPQVAADGSQEGVEVWGRSGYVLLHLGVPLVAVCAGSLFEALAEAGWVDVAVSCLAFERRPDLLGAYVLVCEEGVEVE